MAAARAAGWVPPPAAAAAPATSDTRRPPSPPTSPRSPSSPPPPTPPRPRAKPAGHPRAPTEPASGGQLAADAEQPHEQPHELRRAPSNEPSSPFHKAADAPGALAAAEAALKAAQPRPGLLVRAASNLHHVKEAVHVEEPDELDEESDQEEAKARLMI